MNSIFLAIAALAAVPSFDVQTPDGRTLSGPLVNLSADRLTVAAKQGNVSLGAQEVLMISPRQKPKPVLRAAGVVVELTDGSVIRGRQYLAHGKQARITLADGETVEAPTAAIRTVQLAGLSRVREAHLPQETDTLSAEWSRLTKMKSDSDLLIVRAEENLDYHQGVLHDVSEEAVRFDLDGEVLPVKRSKVFGFVYHHGAEAELPPTVCRITDAAGSQWSVRTLALAGGLKWTTPAGISVVAPLGSIASIDFSGGKLTYLSDLQPETAVWTPYFASENPLPAAKRLYAPRFDRGFESAPLQLARVVYSRGLALYCRTEIVYRLPDRFSRFQAIAGIDDGVRPNGKVRLVIRGDDRTLLDVVVLGTDAPRPIELDLKDVRRLTIVVDFAGGLTAGDRLLLCNARIIK
jgi:hypothetical protein